MSTFMAVGDTTGKFTDLTEKILLTDGKNKYTLSEVGGKLNITTKSDPLQYINSNSIKKDKNGNVVSFSVDKTKFIDFCTVLLIDLRECELVDEQYRVYAPIPTTLHTSYRPPYSVYKAENTEFTKDPLECQSIYGKIGIKDSDGVIIPPMARYLDRKYAYLCRFTKDYGKFAGLYYPDAINDKLENFAGKRLEICSSLVTDITEDGTTKIFISADTEDENSDITKLLNSLSEEERSIPFIVK